MLKDKTHLLTSPSGIFSRVLCISVHMRDSLLDSRRCSRKASFVFEQSGAPFPARGLIILVTKRPELSAILNRDFSDLNASVNSSGAHASPPPPPRANPQALAFFFFKMGKFPGVGTHKPSKCPGVGTKKEGKCPAPGIVAFQHFCGLFLISE